MKKLIIPIICVAFLFTLFISVGCNKKEKESPKELKKVKVAEVTHSLFYTPMYIAHKLEYFEDNGLDVEIILTSGADKVAAAVISKDVQIGFCGSEQTVYIYNQGAKDYLINFAGLTKKDGSFIVSRGKDDNFDIKNLNGKTILGGRVGGMPAMTLNYTLNKNNLNADVDTSVDFANLTSAFVGGTGDYVTLFEPSALALEKEGKGYVVKSVGEIGGEVPYTTFNALKSYIEENPDVIESFRGAIDRGLEYTKKHSSSELAELLVDYFPDTTVEDIAKVIDRYKQIDSWYDTTTLNKKDFDHMQDIIEFNGLLDKRVEFNKVYYE